MAVACCVLCYEQYLREGKVDEAELEEILVCRDLDPASEQRVRASPCMCDCHEIGCVVFH